MTDNPLPAFGIRHLAGKWADRVIDLFGNQPKGGAPRGAAGDSDGLPDIGVRFYNNTGSALARGDLVYVTGLHSTIGGAPVTVAKAVSGAVGKAAQFVVMQAAANSTFGWACPCATITTSLNTSSSSIGAPVYLSTTAGTPTLSGGGDDQVVGYVKTLATTGVVSYVIGYGVSTGSLPTRAVLTWQAGKRGKPSLNADIQNEDEATRMIADPDFEVLGTNATSASTSFNAEGGIKLTTAGASGDQVIILPHLDANQSAWAQWTWGTDKQVEWEGDLTTGTAITAETIWAGLKLTNTSVVATDNDQVFFRYEVGVNSGKWQVIYSIGGTDTTTDAGVTVAVSTRYRLRISIDASRIARCYINGALVATSTALTDATDLIPYIGVSASAVAAKDITVYGETISRTVG